MRRFQAFNPKLMKMQILEPEVTSVWVDEPEVIHKSDCWTFI